MLTRSSSTAITLAGIGSATLTGDSGDNVIAGNLFTGTLTLGATAGTDSLTGNGANTTLRTPTAGTTVNVTALNSGDAMRGATTFSGVGNLRGNSRSRHLRVRRRGFAAQRQRHRRRRQRHARPLGPHRRRHHQSIRHDDGQRRRRNGQRRHQRHRQRRGHDFLGGDLTQTYAVTAPDAFSVGGQNLIGVGSIQAGNQNDTFVVAAAGSLSGTLDGGAGSNTLDLSALGIANFNLERFRQRYRREASPTSAP